MLEGFPVAMSPAPLYKHQRVAVTLSYELEHSIRKAKCKKCKVCEPVDYKVAEDTILQPDVLILCGKMTKSFLDFPPAFVAEILSRSTALRDLNTKYEIYQKMKVKYYMIVDTDKETLDLYELKNKKYELVQHDYKQPFLFIFNDDCKIEVVLDEIWANI